MLKASNSANPNSTVVIAFKPRQVLLAEHRTKSISMSKKKQSKTQTLTLTEEHKTCLLHSVIKYLEKNALSKTLKRIISEAQIQNEEWKTASLDLEELYCKSLDTCNQDETTANTIRKEELQTEGTTKDVISSDCAVSKELIKKNKKKKSKGEKSAAADQSEAIDKKIADSTKNSDELSEVNVLIESAKTKGKKKSKNSTDYSNDNEQVHSLASKEQVENTVSDENGKLTDKVKDKKKKSKSNNADQEEIVLKNVVVEELSKDSASAACDIEKEKKSSKKRKRLVSDENENLSDGNEASEESERRKTKGSEKSKKNKSKITVESKESEKENSQVANIDSTKTSKKQPGEHDNGDLDNTNKVANGFLEKSEDKSAYQKSTKKQRTGSAEPKTVNAFQRVKIDEVEFADEKLQDNSYWAKDGAEIGYGAKAQEVLGQVRGRDFRHEKTKKKRGSYRGGLIDLQSHSVKFSYSDED